MSRFVVVLSALLCALVIGLGSGSLALAQSSSRVPTAEDQDVIRLVMTEENAGWTAETKYLLKAFEIANPIYRVELIIRKEDGFAKSIRELVARGEAPHLILGPSTEIAGLYQTGHLSTQSPRNLNRALGAGAFLPGPLQVFRAGPQKELFGLPYHGWVQAIWYRKSWFQALKLEPPTTIGALVRAAETIKKAQHGIYGIVMGKEADVYGEQSFSMIALSLGLRVVDAEGVPNLNTPEFIGALKIFKRLIDTSPPEANSPVGRDYYFQDRVGMIVYSSHIMDDLALSSAAARSLTGDNYSDLEGKPFNPNLLPDTGIVSALEGIEKAAFGSVVGIAFGAQMDMNARLGAERLAWYLLRPDVHLSWIHKAPGGMLPTKGSLAQNQRFLHDLQGVTRRYGSQQIANLMEGMEVVRNLQLGQGSVDNMAARIMDAGILRRMVKAVASGRRTPEKAVREAQSEAMLIYQFSR